MTEDEEKKLFVMFDELWCAVKFDRRALRGDEAWRDVYVDGRRVCSEREFLDRFYSRLVDGDLT